MRNPKLILEARVRAVNAANAFANDLYHQLVRVFRGHIGQKIEKVDGSLLKKIQDEVKTLGLPNTVPLHVYRNQSNYSLSYTVKTCESVPDGTGYSHAYYHETTVYVGEMDNGVLTGLNPVPNFKTDYHAEVIISARQAYAVAKATADRLKSELYPFEDYDR